MKVLETFRLFILVKVSSLIEQGSLVFGKVKILVGKIRFLSMEHWIVREHD